VRNLAACALVSVLVGACDVRSIDAVGGAGGVYRPDQGCTLRESSPQCPAVGEPTPVLRFESPVNPGVATEADRGTASNLQVTCRRSYCGTGSLSARVDLDWTADPNDPQRMAVFTYDLDTPRDLAGRTLGFAIYVEEVAVPMHAQIGVIFEYWRWVAWSPVRAGWNYIAGVVSPANPLTEIDSSVTSIPVTSLQIDVYVPIDTSAGDNGAWSGTIYLDDIGWQ
jgi:hypothetical protein